MVCTIEDLDLLLEGVSAKQCAASARQLAVLQIRGSRSSSMLYSCDALWTTGADPKRDQRSGPAHQTLRRRGIAPPYPRPIDLTRGTPGKLVMLREGISLEPDDARKPCSHIGATTIRIASFYTDCAEIIHTTGERTLIQCDDIDALDLRFEAHYQC